MLFSINLIILFRSPKFQHKTRNNATKQTALCASESSQFATYCVFFPFFLSQQGVTHQIHKITEKREAVTFVKVDQRRSEV